ncbi:hypothetical protein HAV15_008647 [Penicillium sp. str. |nr:hypothetical protein HAV15_008647 [Penicillium sp. str. \
MLGRLGMTVDECLQAYGKVAERAFTPKAHAIIPARPNGAFSAHALEEAIKQVVTEFCTEKECMNRRRNSLSTTPCQHSDLPFRDQSCTKTVVLALTKANVGGVPTLFRTYDKSTALNGFTIWEAARATSAATTFFKPIKIGRDQIEYVDAGFGHNNPCDKLIAEAKEVFPGRSDMQILSIGTGLGNVVGMKSNFISIIGAMKKMATSSNMAAARLEDRYGKNGQYFRFNVEHGLEDVTLSDWKKASTIYANTNNYLSQQSREIERFAKMFGAREERNEPNYPRFMYAPIINPV